MSGQNNVSKIDKLIRFLRAPDYRFLVLDPRGFYNSMPDEEFLKRKFRARMGYELDLENPQTFNEKLQWLKLHDRKPEYIKMVDKYEVKKYVADIIREEYIIPTLGVWDRFDDIDFSQMPDQFVLQCTHDSGGIIICKDKSKFDIQVAKTKINKSLKRNYYYVGREWPYKDVKPRIIAEPYLEEDIHGLTDYKVHCFNGIPKIILVCKDRFTECGMTEDFFTADWEHLPFHRPNVQFSDEPISKPPELSQMLELSGKLSSGIPFLRCDFYIVNGKLLLGELTFFPASGFRPFIPETYDMKLGSLINLDKFFYDLR